MSDQDWQNKMAAQNVFAQRRNQAIAQAAANGGGAWTAYGDDGSFAAGSVDKNGNPVGTGGNSSSSNSSSNSNNYLSGAGSNLFGNMGDLGNTFNSFADAATNRAKDWAQFQLGINKQQGEQDYDFRNREAQRDFGFQTSLAGQQIQGNQSLENLRQSAETDRLQRSLTSQQNMQQSDFQNQTQQRAQQAALARLGFGGKF